MEWIGLAALGIVLCYSPYLGKIKKLESKIKTLQKRQRGESDLSKLIRELVGKKCKIETEVALDLIGASELQCLVLDVDEEWMKIQFIDKKKKQITKLLRIESIDGIQILMPEES